MSAVMVVVVVVFVVVVVAGSTAKFVPSCLGSSPSRFLALSNQREEVMRKRGKKGKRGEDHSGARETT